MLWSRLFLLLLSYTLSETGVQSFSAKSKVIAGGSGFGARSETPLVHTPDTSKTTQRLLEFLNVQQSKGLEDVEIGYHKSTGVRGVFSKKKFKKGEMMCCIPSDCALALSDPNESEDTPTLSHHGANFFNMYWKNEKARKLFAPYLDHLPMKGTPQFDPTPDFFDDEEVELLEFPRLIRQVKERKEEIAQVAGETGLDLDDLQFATWMTSSRAFLIPISDESGEPKVDDKGRVISTTERKDIRVMIPFIDLANHNSDQHNAKLTLIDPEKDEAWFALEATRPIAPGKEIVIAYGNGVQSSVEILLNYGFVPHVNKIDEIMLKKGGDECITSLDGWTTTLEEDKTMLTMAEEEENLKKILHFRIRLKESYKN